jgi:hypothetical protein
MRWLNKVKEASKNLIDGPAEIKGLMPGHDEESQDPFQVSGEAVKVYLPPLDADVWFCADRQAMERVKHEELACFLYKDLVYIHQGKPGTERLSRLLEVYARRHPAVQAILDTFQGSKVTTIISKN